MHGRGVMFNVNENIPWTVLDIYFNFKDLETIFLEFSFRKRKCLWFCLYKPPNQNEQYFPDKMNKSLTKQVPSLMI